MVGQRVKEGDGYLIERGLVCNFASFILLVSYASPHVCGLLLYVEVTANHTSDKVVTCRSCDTDEPSTSQVHTIASTRNCSFNRSMSQGSGYMPSSDPIHLHSVSESNTDEVVHGWNGQSNENMSTCAQSHTLPNENITASSVGSCECAESLSTGSYNSHLNFSDNGTLQECGINTSGAEDTHRKLYIKKMEITKSLSKTAKFFSMFKNRYKSCPLTSVDGEVCENEIGPSKGSFCRQSIIMNGLALCDPNAEKENKDSINGMTQSLALASTDVIDGNCEAKFSRSLMVEGKEWRVSTNRWNSQGSLSNHTPSDGSQEGQFSRVFSGNSEGLLSEIDAKLSNERGSKSEPDMEASSSGEGRGFHLMRSPSLYGLTSFDDDDSINQKHVGIFRTSSLSLDSSFNQTEECETEFRPDSTPVSRRQRHLVGGSEPRTECDGGRMRRGGVEAVKTHLRSSSQTPSNSSIESSGKVWLLDNHIDCNLNIQCY